MRACVVFVLANCAFVFSSAQNVRSFKKNRIDNQYNDLQEEINYINSGGEFINDDKHYNRVHLHHPNHRPHHHHHQQQNQITGFENAHSFDDNREQYPGVERFDNDAKLRFFYSSMENYTELPLNRANDIFAKSWYNSSKTTVFFAHGYTGHPNGPAIVSVINAYLKYGDHNVVLLNWDKMAAGYPPTLASTYVNYAMPNARKLGVHFANVLFDLSHSGMNLNQTHLIGHSLGAHIFGIAGNSLLERKIQLPWITALDPAAYGFENRPSSAQLSARSAIFVSVIHSDPSKYGFSKALGTVDFWPNYKNGPVIQPGCSNRASAMFSQRDLCNHNRSWELLIDSLKYPGSLIGSYAPNFRKWKNYSVSERNANTLSIGVYDANATKGNYFLQTNAESPYGRGNDGL